MWKIIQTNKNTYKCWSIWTKDLEGFIEDQVIDIKFRKTGVWKVVFYSEFNFRVKSNFSGLKRLSCYLGYLDICVHSNMLRLLLYGTIKRWILFLLPFLLLELLLLLVGGLLLWSQPGLWAHFAYCRKLSWIYFIHAM